MKTTRRTFLQRLGVAGVGALALRPSSLSAQPLLPAGGPLVIATWKNHPGIDRAWEMLQQERSALDAIEQGIRVVEANPRDVSVGYGGLPDQSGRVTLDACIMDHEGNAGSVTYLQHIMHPISVARRIMEETPHVMLSGEGAYRFARAQGFPRKNLLTPTARRAFRNWKQEQRSLPEFVQPGTHDTVGMLGLDTAGRLAGGCSTSGWAYKVPGRVGDSPIIGAGLFVDDEVGAATATGLGELVMKTLSAFLIVEFMRQGMDPQAACEAAMQRIVQKYPRYVDEGHQVGLIALRKDGAIGYYGLRPGFMVTIARASEATSTVLPAAASQP
jgi:N4-(beta-N-acetylglucosaminyl)-L-asparaginase